MRFIYMYKLLIYQLYKHYHNYLYIIQLMTLYNLHLLILESYLLFKGYLSACNSINYPFYLK